jgi:hypothetical protein
MMKRIFLLLTLVTSSGCWGEPQWGEPHHMLSQVNITAAQDVQVKVIESTKQFGIRNGFKVDASNNLPREGRQVMQVQLTRPDGVMVITDNFMNADVLDTGFYATQEGADWRAVKEEWLKEIRAVVGKQGNVVDVILEKEPEHK